MTTLNDVFAEAELITAQIQKIYVPVCLMLIEIKIRRLATVCGGSKNLSFLINDLQTKLLVRRCELLAIHYPSNEEV